MQVGDATNFPSERNSTRAIRSNTTSTHIAWFLPEMAWSTNLYARVRALVSGERGPTHGEWSELSPAWITAKQCSASEYLEMRSSPRDPGGWRCRGCPDGASCRGSIAWDGVVALFGFWRKPGVVLDTAAAPQKFLECLLPPACLGAPNVALKDRWPQAAGPGGPPPPSTSTPAQEGCNVEEGYAPNKTLCHTCADGYRRQGRSACSRCPDASQNAGLMAAAAALAVLGASIVVYMTISDAGKADLAEIIRKSAFNYLQTAALAAAFPLRGLRRWKCCLPSRSLFHRGRAPRGAGLRV